MVEKFIKITFANPNVNILNHYENISDGVHYASLNLEQRFGIIMSDLMHTTDGFLYVKIKIPDQYAEKFNIGYHLRGIAAYLIRKNGDLYRNLKYGNRLLCCVEIPDICENGKKYNDNSLKMIELINLLTVAYQNNSLSDDVLNEMLDKVKAL